MYFDLIYIRPNTDDGEVDREMAFSVSFEAIGVTDCEQFTENLKGPFSDEN